MTDRHEVQLEDDDVCVPGHVCPHDDDPPGTRDVVSQRRQLTDEGSPEQLRRRPAPRGAPRRA